MTTSVRADEASTVLVDQTTTALAPQIAVPLVAGMLVLVLYRIAVVRDRRPTTTAANWYGFWIILYAGTRVAPIQDIALTIPGVTLSDIRVIGSIFDVAAAVSLLLLAIRWRSASGVASRRMQVFAFTAVCASAVILVLLDIPARNEGIAIEEVGGWRFAVYATIYSGFFIPAEALIVWTLVQMMRDKTASVARRALAGFLMCAIAMSVLSLSTRIVGAWLSAVGVDTALSTFRTAVQNDVAFYSSVVWLIPAAAPLVAVDLARRIGISRSAQTEVTKLEPMWRDLTTLAPSFMLTELHDGHRPTAAERIHRMRIEIEDIARAVSTRLDSDTQWPISPRGRAMLLREAMRRYEDSASSTSAPPSWLSDENAVDEVAKVWLLEAGSKRDTSQVVTNSTDKFR